MKVRDISICILRIEGTNCELESYYAFRRLGANPELVHLKQLIGQDTREQERRHLEDYDALMIPGGFSSGDYVRAGAILAARMRSELSGALESFVIGGKPILGICNGFQVLVEMGMLPGFDGLFSEVPTAALATNDSGRFECRPTLLKHVNEGKCIFSRKLEKNAVIEAPSAHAEGKFLFPKEREEEYLEKLIENDQIVFRYVDDNGDYAGYPWNPNGSIYNIAGICNPSGTVFGMMPHPERSFFRLQYPDWTRKGLDNHGDGRAIFESILDYLSETF